MVKVLRRRQAAKQSAKALSIIAKRSFANSGFLGSRVVLGQYKVVVLFL